MVRFIPGGKNARIKRSCIKRVEDEDEIKIEVPSRSIRCIEPDHYTLAMISDARAQHSSAQRGITRSQFLHITLHDFNRLALNPDAAQVQTTRMPIDNALPLSISSRDEVHDTRTIRACLQNLGTDQVELAVITRRRTLADLFAEHEP